ncbi:hypothetical protein FY528_11380 [Hymenobacter lutimineralis]|uniref:Uncharacterized protein n=1 Tax=Hymenobacter lutimineralis TaxID=2606448 RepID=A0A5D6V3D9_9BACT|nr:MULTISPECIES: hypothetical protein [Hymenobacter]QIX61792.1 hypothetical protein HER32_11620 [Hymenobacter sp. BT18]TYZ09339.1 hypothetical protein FY528_11380 [Hymenobacter lutimineralis]
MRHVFSRFTSLFAAAVLLSSAGVVAGPTGPATDQTQDTIQQRAKNLTGYYAFALHLSGRQRRAVQACTYRHLQQLDSIKQISVVYADRTGPGATGLPPQDANQIHARYEATMSRILTTGQFSTFHWLLSQ